METQEDQKKHNGNEMFLARVFRIWQILWAKIYKDI